MKNKITFACICTLLIASKLHAQTVTNNGDTITIANGTTLYINGGFSNTDNGTNYPYIKSNGRINMTGDFVASGNTVYTGTDSLILSGTDSQSIPGLSYGYLGIDSGGNKTLSGNASISNKIELPNGNLYTGAYRLTLDSTATLSEDSADYIIGETAMTRYLSQGDSEGFGGIGLEIKADSLTPGMTSVVRTTGSHLGNGGYESVNRYFTVTPTNNGPTGSTITFHYFGNELNGLAQSDLGMYRQRANSKWEYDSFMTRNSAANAITTHVDTLGVFTLGSIANPLPVQLMQFMARLLTPQSSLLNWQTASEQNNAFFEIERSDDGKNFMKIGEMPGNGTTNTIQNYEYTDHFEVENLPVLYYRLKQVDYNGAFTYSGIRSVNLNNAMPDIQVWYNQGADQTEADLLLTKQTYTTVSMIDAQGKTIVTQNLDLAAGRSHISLDMYGLAEGIYLISFSDENGRQVKRLMKY